MNSTTSRVEDAALAISLAWEGVLSVFGSSELTLKQKESLAHLANESAYHSMMLAGGSSTVKAIVHNISTGKETEPR